MITGPWSAAEIDRLRVRWAEGLTCSKIAAELDRPKNAIVGAAHRYRMPGRPSPLRKPRQTKEPKAVTNPPPPPPVVTLPPLASLEAAFPSEAMPRQVRKPVPVTPPVAPVPTVFRAPIPLQSKTCQFPFGTPGRPGFRFCEELRRPDRPYCAEHTALCYVRPRDRREDESLVPGPDTAWGKPGHAHQG